MRSTVVDVRGIGRRFGHRKVLTGVDLRLPSGATLALTGANGAGKTTFLRILATLLKPSAGEGEICGIPLRSGGDEIRSRVGFVSARGFLYDELTAAENLRFAARLGGAVPTEARIAEFIAEAGLSRAADQPVRTFSTGMRRRLALSTLMIRPLELALVDEPYSGLDAQGVEYVDALVDRLNAAGTAVVIASHQAGRATRGADVAAHIEAGGLRLADSS